MNKKKLLIIIAVVLLGGGYAGYSFLMPKPATAKLKIDGTIYVLPKGFTFNLAGNHYATMTIGLILPPSQTTGAPNTSGTTNPGGIGTLPEEAVIRSIITNVVTGQSEATLISDSGRQGLERQILDGIRSQTDVKVTSILFTDLAVQ
jgi:flagellar protein FliL